MAFMKINRSLDIRWILVREIETGPSVAMKINVYILDFTLAHPQILILFLYFEWRAKLRSIGDVA